MTVGWKIKKLGEVCEFVRGPFGGSLKKECFVADGFAVYEQQHAIYNQFNDIRYFIDQIKFDEMKRFELYPGDLIMSCSGTMGKVAIVPNGIKKGVINQALLKLTPKSSLDVEFLRYWMGSEDFQISISKHSQGAAIQNVASVQILKSIELPFPEKLEQQRIVTILDEAFAAIDQAKANTEKNLQNARELFQSELNSIFTNKGEGWVEKKLKEIGTTQTGTTPKTAEKENYGDYIPFIKPADVDYTRIGDIRYINEGLSEIGLKKGRLIGEGSILMVCIGATIGKVGYTGREVSCNQQINTLTPRKEYDSKFFYYGLTSRNFQDKVLSEGKGAQATLPIINKSKWENLTISYPKSKSAQQQIINQLEALSAETKQLEENYRKKLERLEELKKSILQKAFSGELTNKKYKITEQEKLDMVAEK